MVRVAVIGAGYMGSAHARVLRRVAVEHPGLVELSYIVDVDLARARRVAARYGGTPLGGVEELPAGSVDLAVVAVPTRYHLQVFRQLLGRGVRGFLVEKPLAATLGEAVELVEEARSHGAWVAVGHVERFNPAVMALHRLAARGFLGGLTTYSARRVGPFAPRAGDTDVVYDLGVHEVDNALALMGGLPETARAYTLRHLVTSLNDYALIVLGFGSAYASAEVNRLTPFKQRILHVTGRLGVAVLDYMAQSLTIYRSEGETRAHVEREEPLYLEDLHVVHAYSGGVRPAVDLYQGLAAMLACAAALEAASRGRDVALEELEAYHVASDLAREAVGGYERYRSLLLGGGLLPGGEHGGEPGNLLGGGGGDVGADG